MSTYTIKIYNQSTISKAYTVFQEQPQVTANGASPKMFTNAWKTFPLLTDGSYSTLVYTKTTFACWAQPPGLSEGVTVDSGGVMAMNTDTTDTVTFVYGEDTAQETGFKSRVTPGKAQNGSFQILTGTDFTPANNLVLGLASDNGSGIPSPVATFPAAPNESYNITPVVKFYVADGAYSEGQIIDVTAVSNVSATIDFTGKPFTTAVVAQDANGAFSVKYS
jgi:hypothetical protein